MTTSRALLRSAGPDDLDQITALHTQARTAYYRAGGLPDAELTSPEACSRRREMWLRAIKGDTRLVLCAVREGETVGVLAMGPPLDADVDPAAVGQLHQIHVRPGCWGQGIGSQLHAAFVRYLRDASLTAGVLEAWERNRRAQAFYARHGWQPDGHHRAGPGDANYVRMRLDLGPAARPERLRAGSRG
ncbi:GNAT family N-acetyltransferase [Streptomyces blattellae]|uniref:GNAT family N-acetyltransferase n=1 Tax=Streptomyces blattellae TaxID=2569855 RepID=UPI001E33FCB9|nr:GNAT family N-acetyltransferase [Streptomyces blattellae]